MRIAFAIVFFLNVQCALQFIISPDLYLFAYGLSGNSGEAAIRGIGVAFLMWNATYPLFILNPDKFFYLGHIILIQQLIGLLGETFIYFSLKSENTILLSSIERFIIFDLLGLIVMLITFVIYLITRSKVN